MEAWQVFFFDLLRATIALFVIVDPVGLVPVFIGLTGGLEVEKRRSIFRVVVYTGGGLLFAFAFIGQQILNLFGITLESFMIAGGVLLMILAVESLTKGRWVEHLAGDEDVGVVPLAFPLLAGPGAITTTMLTLETKGLPVTLASILIVMLITWIVLQFVDRIHDLLGKVGTAVVSRVMAVFIAAIAVQFIVYGLRALWPGL